MFFSDDIVFIADTKGGINYKLQIWRKMLKSESFIFKKTKNGIYGGKFSNKRK